MSCPTLPRTLLSLCLLSCAITTMTICVVPSPNLTRADESIASNRAEFGVTRRPDRLIIEHNGQMLGEFVFHDDKILRPYFCNLHAPDGTLLTRRHPPRAGIDATDHDTMHPGLWLAFGDLSGQDFWRNKGRIAHLRFTQEPTVESGRLRFATLSELRSSDYQSVGQITTEIIVSNTADGWLLEWKANIMANQQPLLLGDQEEMGFGARVATELTEKNGGTIRNARGQNSAAETWGQPADWCDYGRVLEGRYVGLTLMAAPTNLRPSWWHNRDYGVFVANMFGRAAMKQGEQSSIPIDPHSNLTLHYAALLHSGTEYDPAAAYQRWAPAKTGPDTVIYRGRYPGWPWISRTPSGTLVCVWREGTEHDYSADGRLQLSLSRDDGKTWSSAVTFFDEPNIDDRNVAVNCLTDHDWLVCFNSYTHDRVSRVWTLRTTDGGATWSPPKLVCDLDARTRSAPIRLSSGKLVLPFYRAPGSQSMAALSENDGKTWTIVEISNGPGFIGDEWDVLELPDKRLVGIIRNNATGLGATEQGWFYVVESQDHGTTWSQAKRTNLRDARSTSPAQIFLHDGKPFVLYANARMVSVVMVTTDDPTLVTWRTDSLIPCYWYRPDRSPIADGSYPVSIALPNNRRFMVDYVHDGDVHAIHGYSIAMPELPRD